MERKNVSFDFLFTQGNTYFSLPINCPQSNLVSQIWWVPSILPMSFGKMTFLKKNPLQIFISVFRRHLVDLCASLHVEIQDEPSGLNPRLNKQARYFCNIFTESIWDLSMPGVTLAFVSIMLQKNSVRLRLFRITRLAKYSWGRRRPQPNKRGRNSLTA